VSAIIDINPSATLYFENGKTLNIQSSHVLFDKTLGRYVRLFAF
jgi:hypothetical protein